MRQPESKRFAVELVNMVFLALWAAPLILLLGYARQSVIVRRNPPEFRL
jgi:hypothetical protein